MSKADTLRADIYGFADILRTTTAVSKADVLGADIYGFADVLRTTTAVSKAKKGGEGDGWGRGSVTMTSIRVGTASLLLKICVVLEISVVLKIPVILQISVVLKYKTGGQ